ncbi:M28 family metallopeptidase [Methanoculleus taiwanensis]|uniref:M28 family metallopeptidase n=1 Tax=Methanoculleus taiwanensis TaxID=1550565 RepID=UPI000FFE501B|nr:M28 family metallopeptidase [Methanoculleus taiwanensis]
MNGALRTVLLIALASVLAASAAGSAPEQTPADLPEYNPAIAGLLAEVNESELFITVADLQSFETRVVGTDGNREAAAYLYDRLSDTAGLDVSYQGGDLANVVATLPGTDPASDSVVVIGAHYDSISSDPEHAPGATDNGVGVAVVLELARIMSQYRFDETVEFAFWNAEEVGLNGSRSYTRHAAEGNVSIPLYLNYDAAGYDPENRSQLNILYNAEAEDLVDLVVHDLALYNISLTPIRDPSTYRSDHISFWEQGYPALMTHAPWPHGPVHTPADTVDAVSFPYAAKNARLGLAVLAEVAGLNGAPGKAFSWEGVFPIFGRTPPAIFGHRQV